jgi:hypothetical protein
MGSNWFLRDDHQTYAFDEGFQNEKLKKQSSLCLYTSNKPSEEVYDTSCYKHY